MIGALLLGSAQRVVKRLQRGERRRRAPDAGHALSSPAFPDDEDGASDAFEDVAAGETRPSHVSRVVSSSNASRGDASVGPAAAASRSTAAATAASCALARDADHRRARSALAPRARAASDVPSALPYPVARGP